MSNAYAVQFSIKMSVDECQTIYAGKIKHLRVRASDGLVYQIPSANFRQFITHHGINGNFMLLFDENKKFIGIRQIN